ncbi:zinc metallopeptidase [Bilifractor porci]|uniref:Zinc metallopeptidase n=1 Tax=Bilifractor porci TaxID=2606636 RepID=A0A7X2TPU2_9FIRM|nr:zinc metallopeptidase [Bilifractor porci]MST82151.1 zinc metallopeptidase [Bilifractor porci]
MYGNYYYYGIDWTYLLILAAFVFTLIVQSVMRGTFRKYSRIRSGSGMTGAQVAQQILASEGLYGVQVLQVSGDLTDHYDPRNKTVSLSQTVYGSSSLAAQGVAAHECGHAIQDAKGYAPLGIRSALVPVANFGSSAAWPLFFIGLLFQLPVIMKIGIFLFLFALLFQLVTLPVEFNASHRAMKKLKGMNLMSREELGGARSVLSAAAMTYVAAAATSLMYLLRMLILSGAGRRDD